MKMVFSPFIPSSSINTLRERRTGCRCEGNKATHGWSNVWVWAVSWLFLIWAITMAPKSVLSSDGSRWKPTYKRGLGVTYLWRWWHWWLTRLCMLSEVITEGWRYWVPNGINHQTGSSKWEVLFWASEARAINQWNSTVQHVCLESTPALKNHSTIIEFAGPSILQQGILSVEFAMLYTRV